MTVVASFIYFKSGKAVGRVDRVEPGREGRAKDFLPYLAQPGGFAATPGLSGTQLPLYHVDDVHVAIASGKPIYFTEGEGKADALRKFLRQEEPFAAVTTIAGGANAALTEEHLAALAEAHTLIILADSDDAGRGAALLRAQRLVAASPTCNVRIVDFYPDRADGSDIADWVKDGHVLEDLRRLVGAARQVGDDPTLLDDVCSFIRRFVVLNADSFVVCTLWLLQAYAIEAFTFTPYLNISSPLRECGKTRLLDVLEILLENAWSTSRSSVAALVRKIARDKCTLLYDETDAAFKGPDDFQQALRGILNAGYQRGKAATICVGREHEPKDFQVFGPKAFAGIGQSLPDTVLSRSIPIQMRRKLKTETTEKFRLRDVEREAGTLRGRLTAWATAHRATLRDARPELPDGLSDRSEDIWEPLVAIADSFGGAWSAWVRTAAITLSAKGAVKDDSIKTRLLYDIRGVFGDADRLHTAILLRALNCLEEAPWSRYHHGDKPLSANGLAKLLRDFGIFSRELKIAGENRNGYTKADFLDVWERFLDSQRSGSTAPTVPVNQGVLLNLQTLPTAGGRSLETSKKACQIRKVDLVEPRNRTGESNGDPPRGGTLVTQTNAGSAYNRVERLLRDGESPQQSLDL